MILEGTSLIVVYVALCICGLFLHFLKKMKAVHLETGKIISFKRYYRGNPYTTLISVVSCIAAFLIFFATGQMNVALALATGYLSDSIVDAISKRAIDKTE